MVFPRIKRIKQEAGGKTELAGGRQQDQHGREGRHNHTVAIAQECSPCVLTILPEHLKGPNQEHGSHDNGDFRIAQGKRGDSNPQKYDFTGCPHLRNRQDSPQDQRRKNKTEADGPMFIDAGGDMEGWHHDIEQGDPGGGDSSAPQSANKRPHGKSRHGKEAYREQFLSTHRTQNTAKNLTRALGEEESHGKCIVEEGTHPHHVIGTPSRGRGLRQIPDLASASHQLFTTRGLHQPSQGHHAEKDDPQNQRKPDGIP